MTTLERHAGHCIDPKTVRRYDRAQVKRHYGKGHNRRNNCTVVCGAELKYGQVEFFLTSEQSGVKWALINEFECVMNYFTYRQCHKGYLLSCCASV